MAPSVRSVAVSMLFVLFLLATEMGSSDAALCDKLSAGFKGYCGRDSDCHKQCVDYEHFSNGECKPTGSGFFKNSKCFCKKPC
ncbi:unnamed protein product [Cuscuta campestris]|uniref:Knottins-like domain-containing protein n=1 Tax=Cuscuta campestris TaxID=132261 RepID=A0A484KHX9_9ASTE|nr:unnamed protein product [Cuscuta campestris]